MCDNLNEAKKPDLIQKVYESGFLSEKWRLAPIWENEINKNLHTKKTEREVAQS